MKYLNKLYALSLMLTGTTMYCQAKRNSLFDEIVEEHRASIKRLAHFFAEFEKEFDDATSTDDTKQLAHKNVTPEVKRSSNQDNTAITYTIPLPDVQQEHITVKIAENDTTSTKRNIVTMPEKTLVITIQNPTKTQANDDATSHYQQSEYTTFSCSTYNQETAHVYSIEQNDNATVITIVLPQTLDAASAAMSLDNDVLSITFQTTRKSKTRETILTFNNTQK